MQTHALPALRFPPLRFRPLSGRNRPWQQQRRPGESSRAASRSGLRLQPVLLRRARLVALAVGRLPAALERAARGHAPGHGAGAALGTGLDRPGRRGGGRRPGDGRAALPAATAGRACRPRPAGTLLLIDAWFDVCTSAPGRGARDGAGRGGLRRAPAGGGRVVGRDRAQPGDPMRTTSLAIAAAGALAAVGAGAAVVLTDQAPYPYAQRRVLDLPLPLLTVRRLDVLLRPRPGERVLEIGPGTGLQSLHVAPQLAAGGELAIVDVQQQMLDHVMARAARRSIGTISPAPGQRRGAALPRRPLRRGLPGDGAWRDPAAGRRPGGAAAGAQARRPAGDRRVRRPASSDPDHADGTGQRRPACTSSGAPASPWPTTRSSPPARPDA